MDTVSRAIGWCFWVALFGWLAVKIALTDPTLVPSFRHWWRRRPKWNRPEEWDRLRDDPSYEPPRR